MNPLLLKVIAVLVLVAVGFGAGWRTKGAFIAERDLATLEAKNEMINTFHSMEGNVAKVVEDKLANLSANQKVIEHEKTTIVERPIYNSECLDQDGVVLVNRARENGHTTRHDSGKLDGARESPAAGG